LPLVLIGFAAAAVLGWAPPERTLFKDLPSNDPVREIVQTVLGSRFFSMRDGFPGREWTEGGFAAAWERARRYFPGKTYYVVPGTFFMTHGFDADGRLFMEIHESAYLTLCVGNRQTFTPDSIVGARRRMSEPADGREAAAFREKLGRLEPYFLDEAAHRGLRQTMGEDLYLGLLKGLCEEDYHMIAGGFMHEGMHAEWDDALVARLQAEFSAGTRPVQWDELRAFMAEIGYHGPYDRWAADDIAGHWRRVENLLGELEGLRKKPRLGSGSERGKFERVRAQAWAHTALIRLRIREIWQSARRMQDLSTNFRKDYVRNTPSAEIGERLTGLERDTAGFVTAVGEAAQATELAVRSLEVVLDTWGEWAEGRRPFPPPVTDSQAVVKQVQGIIWPEPAADSAAALMKKAAEALEKERTPA
jgi:hypothetical protein